MLWAPGLLVHQRYQLLTLKRDRSGHQVWFALDQTTEQKVVIKTLSFSGQIHWDEVKLFEREIAVLKRLKHPCLPIFVDQFSLETPHYQICLVESYIHAPSLQEFLDRQKQIPETQVWAIAAQVLEILCYLHRQDPPILHRDIKPSNILIDRDKQVYLIDFGAIGIEGDRPNKLDPPTTVGSYGYTPMEQFMGQPQRASDLYALGATLMQLLTQKPPNELLSSQLRLLFPQDNGLEFPLRQWIYQLTAPQASDRCTDSQSALQRLKQARTASALASSSPTQRVTMTQSNEGWNVEVEALWNPTTVSQNDLGASVLLLLLPILLGGLEMRALSHSLSGFGLWGGELLSLGLTSLPIIFLANRLIHKLVRQTLQIRPQEYITTQFFLGALPLKSRKSQWCDLAALSVQVKQDQKQEQWSLWIQEPQGRRVLLEQLTGNEISQIYQLLEEVHQE